jgi:hypothetical protein
MPLVFGELPTQSGLARSLRSAPESAAFRSRDRRFSRVFATIAVLLAVPLGAMSCEPEPVETARVPDSVLVEVLVDLQLSRATVELGLSEPDDGLVDSVLEARGVQPGDFEQTLDFYADHPEDYLKVYNRVIEVLAIENTNLSDAP